MRRLPSPLGVAAIAGFAGLLAVTPLVAGGVLQLSAGLIATPTHLQASLSGSEAPRRIEPRQDVSNPELAEDKLQDRFDHAFQNMTNADASEQPAPRFADFDPQRFPARAATEKSPPVVDRYAWISGNAASLSLDGLGQRLAPVASYAALDPVAAIDAIAEARFDGEKAVALPTQDMAADTVEDEVQDAGALAMTIPVPERRPAHSPAANGEAHKALAYAAPDVETEEEKSGGIFGRLFGKRNESLLPGRGSKVAVYDIGAATVYMPNGEKLEAHSGLAHMKDNPRYVKEKNRGPTPPNLYDLRMRESRFHGVEAIRLLPADGKKKYNRDGLLAHTYMYVRGGGRDKSQSNGCVVFKDYEKFLTAFKRGEIEHLIVVPHLREVQTYMAAL